MRLADAVAQTPPLGQAWQQGLGALRAQDRRRIQADDQRRLRGSVDVDEGLKKLFPTSHRWDYAIAFQHSDRVSGGEDVYWVEIHPAHDHGATEVLRKVVWLHAWLEGAGRPMAFVGRRKFVWIASGKIALTRDSRRVRELAAHGIVFPGKQLNLGSRR